VGYVGSRAVEIDAMLAEIESSHGHAGTYLSGPPAGADGAEAVHREGVAAGQLGERAAAERDDCEAMEHERQSRMRRWHAQP
jgi:hypothetical protein